MISKCYDWRGLLKKLAVVEGDIGLDAVFVDGEGEFCDAPEGIVLVALNDRAVADLERKCGWSFEIYRAVSAH